MTRLSLYCKLQDMAGTSSLPMADLAMGGQLSGLLSEWRENPGRQSYETIAFRLRADHGLAVSSATVRRWCFELGIEGEPQDESGSAA